MCKIRLAPHFPKRNFPDLRVSHIRCYVTLAISGDHCPVTGQWNSVLTSGEKNVCSCNHQALCNANSITTSSKTHALRVFPRHVYLTSKISSVILLYSFYLHVLPVSPCTGNTWILNLDCLEFLTQANNSSGFWRNNFPSISCKLQSLITMLWQKVLCTCLKLMSIRMITHSSAFCFP